MRHRVDDILAQRRAPDDRRRRIAAIAVAFVGHALLGAAIALAPAFVARSQAEERQFVRVMIVPAKALGDSTAPARRPPAKPKPAPVVTAPAPESEPAPKAPSPEPSSEPRAEPVAALDGSASSAPPTDTTETDGESTRRRGGPDGTSLGTSPFGSSEASFDDPDFQYNYYVQQMLAIIGGHWVRPRSGLDTEVLVHYEISRSGELREIEVARTSGNRAFDAAGVRAVTRSSPLPPLPQSYPHDSLGVTLQIR